MLRITEQFLNEENILRWQRYEYIPYKDKFLVALQSHANNKTNTNFSKIANKWLFNNDLKFQSFVFASLGMAIAKNILQPEYNIAAANITDRNDRSKFVLHYRRTLTHPDYPEVEGVVFYDIMFNLTAPFVDTNRLGRKTNLDYVISKNPNLSGLKNVNPELLLRPFILVQSFTGGFKPILTKLPYGMDRRAIYRGSRYDGKAGDVQYPASINYIEATSIAQVPQISAEEFNELVIFQKLAQDSNGNTVDAWYNYPVLDGSLIFNGL